MAKKKVLIVEDYRAQGLALKEMLEARGFEVYNASLVAEARALAEKHWKDIDVAVLDMRMEKDPDHQGLTGADIAVQVRRDKNKKDYPKDYPPEFLIYSAYAEIPFYKLALQLGVAAYLSKMGEANKVSRNLPEAVLHVRILALRRALNSDNPMTSKRVARIAAQSGSQSEAIRRFCREILKPEFESCLGAPFVVLFSEESQMTENCATNATGLPEGSSKFYHTLQALAHGIGNPTEPFVLNIDQLKRQIDFEADQSYEKLDGAAFVPLPISQKYKLSIGILQEPERTVGPDETVPPVENAEALGTILAQYLRPTVLENMLNIWPQWTELKAIRSSVAKLCLFVGQELKYVLPRQDEDEQPWLEDSLGRLWDLAHDLDDTGRMLRDLEDKGWKEESKLVSIKGIADESWGMITKGEEGAEESFKVEGDCLVEADEIDLNIAVSRLLHWFAQRRSATPVGEQPLVTVKCGDDEGCPTVLFEDRSQRLKKKLRAEMFAPFAHAVPVPFPSESETGGAQAAEAAAGKREGRPEGRYLPLYLAKMLVEGRYNGTLEDHSDDDDLKDLTYGHRVVMRFPPNGKRP
jgi:CheY-like chemotaxis protein